MECNFLDKLAEAIVNKRKKIILIFVLLCIICAVLTRFTNVTYDLTVLLPEDSPSTKAIKAVSEEFGMPGSVRALIYDVSVAEAEQYKQNILAVDGVTDCIWLDDFEDIYKPAEFFSGSNIDKYYKDNNALFYIYFTNGDYDSQTGESLLEVEEILGDAGVVYGSALTGSEARQITDKQITSITLWIVPIMFLILLLATTSWFEPVLFMISIGVSVLLNMGTNAFLPQVTFITQSMSTALQLAISMDYSIFLLHRFGEERKKGMDINAAMVSALKKSFSAVSSSSVTTIVGFVALVFMRFRLGADMGYVFAKGIAFSLICVLVFLPAITIYCAKIIEKTQHHSFLPNMRGIGKFAYSARYFIVILVVVIVIPTYLAQSKNDFVYGNATISNSANSISYKNRMEIENIYGTYNPVVLIVKSGEPAKESAMSNDLLGLSYVTELQSISSLAGAYIPQEFLPDSAVGMFKNDRYSRMILNITSGEESLETFETIDKINEIAGRYYDDFGLAGSSVATKDIRDVASSDFANVNLIAILLVGVVLLVAFRNLSLPVLLVFVIESAIFVNMAMPYFENSTITFIGYMVVSSIQLGATIDYAILLTSHYLEHRAEMGKKDSIIKAMETAGPSILTAASILISAGLVIFFISQLSAVSELGLLIGRGALLSMIMVFVLLPAVLVVFDKAINFTKLNKRNK